jgi:hypothetical protein
MGEVVEIFVPVFVALVLHSGIMRLLDEIQMYFVSKRISAKVSGLLQDEAVIEDKIENLLKSLREDEKTTRKNNDPNGEWRYFE